MADGRDDRSNVLPNRGAKLRYQGSNPTGSQTRSFKPEYSDEMDYEEGGNTHLNQRTRAKQENHDTGYGELAECCKENGIVFKQPL